MKAVITTLFFLALSAGAAYGVVPDYLKASSSEVTPSYTAKIGQLINAHMVLTGGTPVPDEARLNITTQVGRPRIEVVIDGKLEQYGIPQLEIALPPEGVKSVEIFVFGVAPEVTKETKIGVLDVKTYVKYKGEEGVYQEDGRLSLTVSNIVISGTVEALETAKRKIETAKKTVADLRVSGAATAPLEAKIENAETVLKTADTLYEKGDIELAKSTAESAIKILDEVVSDAGKLKATKETRGSLTKYGLAAVGIIVVAGLLLFVLRRREELG